MEALHGSGEARRNPHLPLTDAAGLETPFGPEALRKVAAKAKEWLEGFDAGKLQ